MGFLFIFFLHNKVYFNLKMLVFFILSTISLFFQRYIKSCVKPKHLFLNIYIQYDEEKRNRPLGIENINLF